MKGKLVACIATVGLLTGCSLSVDPEVQATLDACNEIQDALLENETSATMMMYDRPEAHQRMMNIVEVTARHEDRFPKFHLAYLASAQALSGELDETKLRLAAHDLAQASADMIGQCERAATRAGN